MVTDSLFAPYIDEKYRKFALSLSPSDKLPRMGIRIPILRKLSKEVDWREIEINYMEDVILKGLAMGFSKESAENKTEALSSLLPYLSSWDQCDIIQSAFKVNEKNRETYFSFFTSLLSSKETFIRRIAIVWLMSQRKRLDWEKALMLIAESDNGDDYYISMAVAWALATFYADDTKAEEIFSLVSEDTRKRAIRKIRESRRCANPPQL